MATDAPKIKQTLEEVAKPVPCAETGCGKLGISVAYLCEVGYSDVVGESFEV
jgi:hypothetical protein